MGRGMADFVKLGLTYFDKMQIYAMNCGEYLMNM